MSFGLLGLQQDMKGQAVDGYARVADLEQRRNQANDNIDAAKTAQRNSNIGAGAGLGLSMATAGASGAAMGAKFGAMAGPVGLVGGAAAGYLFSKFFG
ncbi:hypothetical protein NFC81_09040 [Salinispirillum sp. LH 10-3-1]|uniref:Bacteriocin n=1 Tax=Salinispirillum sp. LH 10-3-1 TaxID=2952525 RepID=A0AB38YC80_9GAMM